MLGSYDMDLSLRTIYRQMGSLIQYANVRGDYGAIWDEFWSLSKGVRVYIEYYDPDTTYEEDIMARYAAIGRYLGDV